MAAEPASHAAELSFASWQRIDAACEAFEAAYRAGCRPDRADFFGSAVGAELDRLATELEGLERELKDSPDAASTSVVARTGPRPRRRQQLPDFRAVGYHLLTEIGRGGMGVVYKARQTSLHRDVAVKLLHETLFDNAEAAERFRGEAEGLARLDHPNIVKIHEVGTHDGVPFLVLEYLPGGSLQDRLDGRPWPPAAAAAFVRTLADAIHEAHKSGLIHRDLKPANVLLQTPPGSPPKDASPSATDGSAPLQSSVPKIADFGLVKRLDLGQSLTMSGEVIGTPRHMAPEQFATATPVTPATDVYALGVILYELLTGQLPFPQRDLPSLIDQVQRRPPPPPGELVRNVPRDLETICLKCLRKSPAHRYDSAVALKDDLDRFLAGRPVLARPLSVRQQLVLWCRRQPLVAGLLLALVAVTLVGLAATSWLAVLANRRAVAADESARAAQASEEKAKETAQFVRLREFDANLLLAQNAWHRRDPRRLLDYLESQRPTADEPDLRGFEWHYWYRRLRTSAHRTLAEHTGIVETVAFSPDGRLLASGGYDRQVLLWNPDERRLLRRWRGHGGTVSAVAFSPDGHFLASSGHDGTVRVWDTRKLGTDEPALLVKGPATGIHDVKYAPDGASLWTAGADGAVCQWEAATGRQLRVVARHPRKVVRLRLSADGKRLLTSGEDDAQVVWEVATGRELRRFEGKGAIWPATLSADGGRVALGNAFDGDVVVLEVETGREVARFPGIGRGTIQVAFSPDGQRLVATGHDAIARLFDLTTGREETAFLGHSDAVYGLGYAPGGESVATGGADGLIHVWDVRKPKAPAPAWQGVSQVIASASGAAGRMILLTGQGVSSWDWSGTQQWAVPVEGVRWTHLAVSPDGKVLATVAANGHLRLWDPVSGRTLADLRREGPEPHGVCFAGPEHLVARERGGTIAVWDVTARRERHRIRSSGGELICLAGAPTGGCFVTGDRAGTVRVWSAADGTELRQWAGDGGAIESLVVSGDGGLIATGGADNTVRGWDARTGQSRFVARGHAGVPFALRFDPTGRRLASGAHDGGVKVWDTRTGLELLDCPGHRSLVRALEFSTDGRLLSGTWEGDVRVWDGRPLPLAVHAGGPELRRWFESGVAALERGHGGEYRRDCQQLFDGLTGDERPVSGEFSSAVWLATLCPDAVSDWRPVLSILNRQAEKPLRCPGDEPPLIERSGVPPATVRGLAKWRAGEVAEAARDLEKEYGTLAERDREPVALVLALAHARLGNAGLAEAWTKASAPGKDLAGKDSAGSLPRRVWVRRLREELDGVLKRSER